MVHGSLLWVLGMALCLGVGCRWICPSADEPGLEAAETPRDRARRATFRRQLEQADQELEREHEQRGDASKQVDRRLRSPRDARARELE